MSFRRYIFFFILFFALISIFGDIALASRPGVNGAAAVLCDVVLLIGGRMGRAIALIALVGMSFAFFTSKVNWQLLLTFSVGLSLMFGAKRLALLILPSTLSGISGSIGKNTYQPENTYTPEQLINEVCPELSEK